MPSNASDRASLTTRLLPEMRLSDGSSSSLTAPPPPPPHYLNAEGRARYRFAVEGNAISTLSSRPGLEHEASDTYSDCISLISQVTGGAGTLALENAWALLEHGLSGLAIFDVNPDQSAAAISNLRTGFPSAKIVTRKVDVTNAENVKEAVESTKQELGSIDIVCCFAGVVGCTHAVEMTPEEWRRTLEINTTGAFLCSQAAAKAMIEQKSGGSIVLIASISAHRVNYPQPQAAYNVSKASLISLKSCLAAEWAVHGIRVNSISPGYMDTILNDGPGLERARNSWKARNPMGRMGVPQELTGPLIMLCSNAGSYMNGADVIVDGGGSVF